MIQTQFAHTAKTILEKNDDVIGLAVGGSWLADQLDEFSDLDLVLVTKSKISGDKRSMLGIAEQLGDLLSGFTGEHVGEPRVLICLFDNPLLHVDIKFLTLDEFRDRVETPVLLLDRDGQLQQILDSTDSRFPLPDYQWIEDRFWIWVHYVLLKIGRGEYLEALDCFGFLRMTVFGPLLHIKNGRLPRGVRKVETDLDRDDLLDLEQTIPTYDKRSLLDALRHSVFLYRRLRTELFDGKVLLQNETEKRVMEYFDENYPSGK
jgi:predicted nucleotidyltransferase